MIQVELTDEMLNGEPGPNFYWRGLPEDFLSLVNALHELGRRHGVHVSVSDLDFVEMVDGHRITAVAAAGGTSLVKVQDREVTIELDARIWQQGLAILLSVSYGPSSNYVEFDNCELREDANFLINSR
ncbi:MAG: hypothetical protein EOP06_07265 [Proteobacteria bacterium]|nr:MAG: hypothetical protein EOP06_07265 [Pseudomonadota bacterium]